MISLHLSLSRQQHLPGQHDQSTVYKYGSLISPGSAIQKHHCSSPVFSYLDSSLNGTSMVNSPHLGCSNTAHSTLAFNVPSAKFLTLQYEILISFIQLSSVFITVCNLTCDHTDWWPHCPAQNQSPVCHSVLPFTIASLDSGFRKQPHFFLDFHCLNSSFLHLWISLSDVCLYIGMYNCQKECSYNFRLYIPQLLLQTFCIHFILWILNLQIFHVLYHCFFLSSISMYDRFRTGNDISCKYIQLRRHIIVIYNQ